MSVLEIALANDQAPEIIARGLINLLRRGLVKPREGTIDEAIADLENQIATGDYS